MAKLNTQFHATPTEIINFIIECARLHNLFVVTINLFPTFEAKLFDADDTIDISRDTTDIRFIYLYCTKPDMSKESYEDFLRTNSNCLICTLGKFKDDVLEESSFGAITEDADSLKLWKKIIKNFNDTTIMGAWVVNPYSGAKGYYKNHRYTRLAQQLFEEGTKIAPFAGWNYYILKHEL